MRIINIIFIAIIFEFGFYTVANSQVTANTNDTSFLKSLKYDKLNNLVGYHIINDGKPVGKSNQAYTIKSIAAYYFYNHSYGKEKTDTLIFGKSGDVTKLILSNKFSNRLGFDGIFRVDSKAMLVYKPWILKKMTVTPKSSDANSLHTLISKLKEQTFISEASLTIRNFQWIGGVRKSVYVMILLKPAYRNIKSENKIKMQLKKWPDISDVSSAVDLFTGNSEYETIFRITSKEK